MRERRDNKWSERYTEIDTKRNIIDRDVAETKKLAWKPQHNLQIHNDKYDKLDDRRIDFSTNRACQDHESFHRDHREERWDDDCVGSVATCDLKKEIDFLVDGDDIYCYTSTDYYNHVNNDDKNDAGTRVSTTTPSYIVGVTSTTQPSTMRHNKGSFDHQRRSPQRSRSFYHSIDRNASYEGRSHSVVSSKYQYNISIADSHHQHHGKRFITNDTKTQVIHSAVRRGNIPPLPNKRTDSNIQTCFNSIHKGRDHHMTNRYDSTVHDTKTSSMISNDIETQDYGRWIHTQVKRGIRDGDTVVSDLTEVHNNYDHHLTSNTSPFRSRYLNNNRGNHGIRTSTSSDYNNRYRSEKSITKSSYKDEIDQKVGRTISVSSIKQNPHQNRRIKVLSHIQKHESSKKHTDKDEMSVESTKTDKSLVSVKKESVFELIENDTSSTSTESDPVYENDCSSSSTKSDPRVTYIDVDLGNAISNVKDNERTFNLQILKQGDEITLQLIPCSQSISKESQDSTKFKSNEGSLVYPVNGTDVDAVIHPINQDQYVSSSLNDDSEKVTLLDSDNTVSIVGTKMNDSESNHVSNLKRSVEATTQGLYSNENITKSTQISSDDCLKDFSSIKSDSSDHVQDVCLSLNDDSEKVTLLDSDNTPSKGETKTKNLKESESNHVSNLTRSAQINHTTIQEPCSNEGHTKSTLLNSDEDLKGPKLSVKDLIKDQQRIIDEKWNALIRKKALRNKEKNGMRCNPLTSESNDVSKLNARIHSTTRETNSDEEVIDSKQHSPESDLKDLQSSIKSVSSDFLKDQKIMVEENLIDTMIKEERNGKRCNPLSPQTVDVLLSLRQKRDLLGKKGEKIKNSLLNHSSRSYKENLFDSKNEGNDKKSSRYSRDCEDLILADAIQPDHGLITGKSDVVFISHASEMSSHTASMEKNISHFLQRYR